MKFLDGKSNLQYFKGYKLNLDQFCETFKVDQEAIKYLAKIKLIKSEFGFYLIKRADNDFFFHEEDILGKITKQLIKDIIVTEIIRVNLDSKRKSINLDLDHISEEISNEMINQGYIWDAIKEPYEILIEKMIIKLALDLGIPKTSLWDI